MRILLVKTSSLGDVIHNLPVASDIRRRLPDAVIDWVVEESFADIPRLHPAISKVIPVAVRRWRKALFSAGTWRELNAYSRLAGVDFYDAIIDTQGLLKSALLAGRAKGPKFGHAADSAREPIAARFYDQQFSVPRQQNAVLRNRQLVAAALGYALDDLPLDYGIGAPPLSTDWLPQPYAVLLTATSRADKEWPEERWLALGAALNAAGLVCVLPGGSATERARAERLAHGMAQGVAAPPMRITELAGLMQGARIVVGVDTGLVHLAAALERPTIALYCGSDPTLTGVLGTRDFLNLGTPGTPPAADEVVAAAVKLLD